MPISSAQLVNMQSNLFSKTLLSYVAEICKDAPRPSLEQEADISRGSRPFPANSLPAHDGLRSQTDFLKFLSDSSRSNACAPLPEEDLDMTWPMSSYYISTSHNTYLSGNQLYGAATAGAYRRVLQQGCRCIEIDVWDGRPTQKESRPGDDTGILTDFEQHLHLRPGRNLAKGNPNSNSGEPRVLHGHTLTTEIPFRVVCEAVKACAFTSSHLPLIVSLEVHCSAEQQSKMADIIRETWGDALVAEPVSACQILPSPNDLRDKILIKVKGASIANPRPLNDHEQHYSSESDDNQQEHDRCSPKADVVKKAKISSSLGALGIYTKAYHFKGFETLEARIPVHVFSLSEKKVLHEHNKDDQRLFTHNRCYLMRAFPSGLRVRSTNLDPVPFWRKGVQMAALNWQKLDEGTMINMAMFADSDGWILKPPGYRHPAETTEPLSTVQRDAQVIQTTSFTLELRFLCAVGLVGARRPFVRCQLHVDTMHIDRQPGNIDEQDLNQHKRNTKHGSGDSPDFLGETVSFGMIDSALLKTSFLRFKIMESAIGTDNLLYWACIRLDRLQSGYRLVHLMDLACNPSDAVLFLHIAFSSR